MTLTFILSSWARCMLFDEDTLYTLLSIYFHKVIATFSQHDLNLWPWKPITFILYHKQHLCYIWSKYTQTFYPKFTRFFYVCLLWPWPLTSKINRIHRTSSSCQDFICLPNLIKMHITVNFFPLLTRLKCDRHTHTLADETTEWVLYPLCNAWYMSAKFDNVANNG